MELNPNHEVTSAMREQWHKLVAVLVHQAGGHVVIGLEAIRSLPPGCAITIQELPDGLHLRLVDRSEADRIVRKQGGLPT